MVYWLRAMQNWLRAMQHSPESRLPNICRIALSCNSMLWGIAQIFSKKFHRQLHAICNSAWNSSQNFLVDSALCGIVRSLHLTANFLNWVFCGYCDFKWPWLVLISCNIWKDASWKPVLYILFKAMSEPILSIAYKICYAIVGNKHSVRALKKIDKMLWYKIFSNC
jgi:hypothetical protein